MRMINDCLEMTVAKRAEIDAYDNDRRHLERKAMIEERRERRGEGNRKQRRAELAMQRKGECV